MKMDARRLIHDLGGQAEVKRKLAAAGHAISTDGLEKWCVRGSVPGEWLLRLSEADKFDIAAYKLKPTKRKKNERIRQRATP